DDGFMIEFLESHTNVVAQRAFDEPGYAGCNPYALGFAMFSDIRRICEQPTDEDRQWFPEIAGTDWRGALDFAMRNFKDESFVAQFLSPRLIREFRLFAIADQEGDPMLEVACIHNDAGYRRVRKLLAAHYDRDARLPDIQVTGFERDGDRSLTLRHVRHRGRPLDDDAERVLAHLQRLWGFTVRMQTVDPDGAPCAETMIAD
ncbi:MAG TPA: SpoVR family protein, partial [Burkholderiaceae bacterium]|nr:SpoVR family protein [Burkholderiaceae bacterium]